MRGDIRDLVDAALKLLPEARGALASRLEDLDSGKVKTIPWSEARRQILRVS